MNVEVRYQYRDASNYKQYESVVVKVVGTDKPQDVEKILRERFSDFQVWPDVVHFRPEDLGWPTAYFEDHYYGNDDLGLHELESIVATCKAPFYYL